ncbi:peptidase G2 autoproteolytic cleavage domain-containing protein [Bacillus velezensis]|uniref:peptidase G2 autoproteolytic cleavage domain-containing protein n=1 Tax=Bacillus velezensis TaxID=492670 RepID=UPI002DBCE5CA|nr:peptidase G2 autoproteolytic cleavage domain-containing protein [Bacillus velezensis]MEC3659242.1 peptidase G2 autoproteolytic cleavage domain-containing protein [Bacillus velezensis]MEC3685480.1 peptidase G2 autoproteolytic cleavage domain-containing protein [Bacillus velezensis]MEC3788430.1 peptidase G2 autoproteolytic cleavage domain-containing protein [Bacillus velezensis]MEC3849281.1 peptidase G2 autoproteolytic cleavage domain-containing protein [Bacillus velezensis]
MVRLIKQHEPYPNSKLLSQLDENARLIENGINDVNSNLDKHKKAQTAHTSEQISHGGFSLRTYIDGLYNRLRNLILNADGTNVKEVVDARVDAEGNIEPLLKERLDKEYYKLLRKIQRDVNVDDYGADPTGETDSTEAFVQALSDGKVRLNLSAGTYIVKGVKLPSWTYLVGQGKGVTTLKLHEDTPASEWVITNADHAGGNRNIYVEGMTLDWNPDRQGGVRATGGIHSSCLTYAKVKFGWVKDVEAVNPGLHGFDITASTYDITAENYTADGSYYVWLDNCVASGYGDDGITTHYSEYIFISNSHCMNPSGKAHAAGQSNSNGIEIDDGSKNVWVDSCYTSGNIRGVEVKAHTEWPASQNVHVTNHISYRDVRSYDARHIGHHSASDPESKSAYHVTFANCTSIEPVFNSLYEGISPRALVISAYKHVQISNFTAIGDPQYDYKANPVVAFQFKSRYINVDGIKMRGFKTASHDIRAFGGAQRTDYVQISGVTISESSPIGVAFGGGVYNASLIGATLIGDSGEMGVYSPNNKVELAAIKATGYASAANLGGRSYSVVPTNFKGGFKGATTSGSPLDPTSAIIAATGANVAKGPRNFMGGVSGGSSTEGSRQAILATNNSHTKGDSPARTILSSQSVINDDGYTVVGGYGSGEASAGNIKWKIDSMNGNIQGVGRVESVSDFKDVAEYFESLDGKRIDSGLMVTLEGDKIRKAQPGDSVDGIISETAGVVLGGAGFYWNDRFLRNEFGGMIYETIIENGRELVVPKENPNYDPTLEYIPRDERIEWHIVGLIGQIHVRIDDTVKVGDRVTAGTDGIATKTGDDSGFKVMRIKTAYDSEKGYGVAVIFMR